MKYKVIREFYGDADAKEPNRVFTDFVETNNPDDFVRPYCLGGGARCDISEYADSRRKYEISAGSVRQVITLCPWEEQVVPDRPIGGINCLRGC